MEGRAENGSGVKKIRVANTRSSAIDGHSLSAALHTQRSSPQEEFQR